MVMNACGPKRSRIDRRSRIEGEQRVARRSAIGDAVGRLGVHEPAVHLDELRAFVESYVWKMGMLELRAQYPSGLPAATYTAQAGVNTL